MGRRKPKKDQVDKVAKETGVDAKDLNRLPADALKKIDDLTPDEGDLLGGDDAGDETGSSADVGGENDDGDGVSEDGPDNVESDSVDSSETSEHGPDDDQPSVPSGTGTGEASAGDESEDGVSESDSGQGSVEDSSEEVGSGGETGAGDGPDTGSPSQEGTVIVGEVILEEVETSIEETPSPTPEVETGKGSGDTSEDVPPVAPAKRVLIGYHPVSGKPVYSDEQ